MATYLELENMIINEDFKKRVVWALRIAAEDIINDPNSSEIKVKIADKVRRNNFDPKPLIVKVLQNATIGASITGSTTSATDADIQFVVNSLFNSQDILLIG